MLATVGANRHELVALQAIDAPVMPRYRRGTQPRLVAMRAFGSEVERWFVHCCNYQSNWSFVTSPVPETGNEEPVCAVQVWQQLPI